MFLILLLLRLICLADGVFPAVGALFRLSGTAEDKMALITDKNHFNHLRHYSKNKTNTQDKEVSKYE